MISDAEQQKIDLLPQNVARVIYGLELVNWMIRTREKFNLTQEKVDLLNRIIINLFLREIAVEQVSARVQKDLDISVEVAGEITFTLFAENLYDIRDFFPGLSDEILRLGGQIPVHGAVSLGEQFAKREAEIERLLEQERLQQEQLIRDSVVTDYLENLLVKYPIVGDQMIGGRDITVKGLPTLMRPVIKCWVDDYLRKSDVRFRNNLERIRYVCHDRNTRQMNSEERRQLMLVLKSIDQEVMLPFSVAKGRIDFTLIEG